MADVAVLRALEPVGSGLADTFFAAQQAGGVSYLTAWDGPEPLGQGVLVFGSAPATPELKNVNVRAEHRSRGVGSAIIRAAEEWCRAQGAEHLEIGVDRENSRARALYERLGYVGTGRVDTVTYEYVDDHGTVRSATETSEQLSRRL